MPSLRKLILLFESFNTEQKKKDECCALHEFKAKTINLKRSTGLKGKKHKNNTSFGYIPR